MLEYKAPNGDLWRIESGQKMLDTLELEEQELTLWHDHFVGERKSWIICTRFFGVSPVILPDGADEKDYDKWPLKTIAEHLGISQADIERELEFSMSSFRELQAYRSTLEHNDTDGGVEIGKDTGEETDRVARELAAKMPEEEVEMILVRHGMDHVIDDDERRFVISRIPDMEHYLSDDTGKILAQQALNMELEIRDLAKRLSKTRGENPPGQALPKSYKDMQSEIKQVRAQYADIMSALGAVEKGNPSLQRRVEFTDSIGGLIRKVKEYKADPRNELVDGMSTAAEIQIAMTPYKERPVQYRSDIAVRSYFSKMYLWDKDWKGQNISAKVCKFLIAARDHCLDLITDGRPIISLQDNEQKAREEDELRAEEAITSSIDSDSVAGSTDVQPIEPGGEPGAFQAVGFDRSDRDIAV